MESVTVVVLAALLSRAQPLLTRPEDTRSSRLPFLPKVEAAVRVLRARRTQLDTAERGRLVRWVAHDAAAGHRTPDPIYNCPRRAFVRGGVARAAKRRRGRTLMGAGIADPRETVRAGQARATHKAALAMGVADTLLNTQAAALAVSGAGRHLGHRGVGSRLPAEKTR